MVPDGADDEARTRYLHLGKVALYQMSYIRILSFFTYFLFQKKASGASGRNRTTDTGIFSPLLYRLSYRGIFSYCWPLSLGEEKVATRMGLEPTTSSVTG